MGEKKRRMAAGGIAVAEVQSPVQTAEQLVETGLRLQREGRLPEALTAYQRALERNPQQADAIHYQGLALIAAGQPQMGVGLLQRSLQLKPDHAGFHYNIGLHLRRADSAAALQHLARAYALVPADLEYTLEYARLLSHAGDDLAALEVLAAGHRHHPASGALAERLVQLAYALNHLELARSTAQEIARQYPQFEARFRVGYALPRSDAPENETVMSEEQWQHATLHGEALRQFIAERDLHVIDNFLPDPAAWREHALQQAFQANLYEGQNFPGVQTDGQPSQDVMERIATVLQCPLKWSSPDNGAFRVSVASAQARSDIHIDNESQGQSHTYAAVLYLNPPQQCQGGTTFWRHRATGWDRRPTDEAVRAAGYADFAAFQESWSSKGQVRTFDELQTERATWEAQAEIPMRSNRLVIYRGNYYHAISNVFGGTLHDGRLAQLFFFETVPASEAVI